MTMTRHGNNGAISETLSKKMGTRHMVMFNLAHLAEQKKEDFSAFAKSHIKSLMKCLLDTPAKGKICIIDDMHFF